MARWSKLQKELYLIIDKKINFKINCSVYRMQSERGSTNLPRYFIMLDKEIIFDYPKQFLSQPIPLEIKRQYLLDNAKSSVKECYPHYTEVSDISDLFREYIDTPVDLLLTKKFKNDRWGLTDILKASDRRIGLRRLNNLLESINNVAAKKIILKRQSMAK